MTNEVIADACVPIAARLAATVRDEGPAAVSDLLRQVPDGRLDALCVVLAAMVDPDRTPEELLAWSRLEGPSSLEYRRLIGAGVSYSTAATLAVRADSRVSTLCATDWSQS